MANAEEILAYWLDQIGPSGWYSGKAEIDQEIEDRFSDVHNRAMDGALSLWLTYPSGTLAYILLCDQFSRNMFRNTDKAFASDRLARAAAKTAIAKGWDKRIDEPARHFFYMPLVHSECLSDQDRAVRLILTRLPETGSTMLLHAQAHREIIRRFGRFPARSAALGRDCTPSEQVFLDAGGYKTIVEELKLARAAA